MITFTPTKSKSFGFVQVSFIFPFSTTNEAFETFSTGNLLFTICSIISFGDKLIFFVSQDTFLFFRVLRAEVGFKTKAIFALSFNFSFKTISENESKIKY